MAIACITGASSGIGMEFAKQLSFMGYNLILVARNRKALKELADSLPTKCMIITCDLASEDSCRTLADKLKKYNIRILINNAGFGDVGAFCETSLSKELDMIDVNVKATHILTKELLPGFIKRNCGYFKCCLKCRTSPWRSLYGNLLCNKSICYKFYKCDL